MTYGENIVSICQDNTGTDETIENNEICNFLLENIQPDVFRKRSLRIFSNFGLLKIYT